RLGVPAARAQFHAAPAGGARAYGNRRTRTRETAIPAGLWTATGTPRVPRPPRAGIGLDVTPDGSRFALGAQWERTTDGHRLAEVIDADTPTRETPAFIAEVARTVGESRLVVDRASVGAVELVDAITRAAPDVEVEFTNMQQ